MERVLTVCANALCRELDVSILTIYQKGRPFYFPLDKRIHCYDLGLGNAENRKLLKQRLTEFMNEYHFNVVISLGGIDMYYLHSINDGSKKIVWFHFAFNVAYTAWLGESPSVVSKLRGYLQHIKRIVHARRYERVIAISKADCQLWQRYTHKAIHINNPVTITPTHISNRTERRAISVGRLDYQKGFDYLIPVWRLVAQKHPEWHLNIYGEGILRDSIQKQIEDAKLTDSVTLCGRTTKLAEIYPLHSIYVMTSRTEALGLVLLEAASCGLPLIAFDCPSGPREIIKDGQNGFLIDKVGDVYVMADKICQLIEDEGLRMLMGDKARAMTDYFNVDYIREQWIDLLDKL